MTEWFDLLTPSACMACNSPLVACTSSQSVREEPCCALCDHEGLR